MSLYNYFHRPFCCEKITVNKFCRTFVWDFAKLLRKETTIFFPNQICKHVLVNNELRNCFTCFKTVPRDNLLLRYLNTMTNHLCKLRCRRSYIINCNIDHKLSIAILVFPVPSWTNQIYYYYVTVFAVHNLVLVVLVIGVCRLLLVLIVLVWNSLGLGSIYRLECQILNRAH